jgi:hypothetical protein
MFRRGENPGEWCWDFALNSEYALTLAQLWMREEQLIWLQD